MCLALYLTAVGDLPLVDEPTLRVRATADSPAVLGGARAVQLGTPDCACGLLRDGCSPEELAVQERVVDRLVAYLTDACAAGPVRMLLCWSGDDSPPLRSSMSVAHARDLDFDAAVDVPVLVTISSNDPTS